MASTEQGAGLRAFVTHVQSLKEKDERGRDGFAREYARIKGKSMQYMRSGQYTVHYGKSGPNSKKNRYKDIVPFDYCRVRLPAIPGIPGSDYINASYLAAESGARCAVIAAQGPLPKTVVDFWRMLWSHNIKVVVMAAKVIEAGKRKCEKYWPGSGSSEMYGEIKVTHVKANMKYKPDFVVTELLVECQGTPRTIHHFQYLTWPDHGVPSSPVAVMRMMAMARDLQPREDEWPIVIHCSAGCGRTGTLAAIDWVWHVLKTKWLDAKFDVFDLICEYRKRRQSIVQTCDQYLYVYKAILDLVKKVLEGLSNPESLGRVAEEDLYGALESFRQVAKTVSRDRRQALSRLAVGVGVDDVKVAKDKNDDDEGAGVEWTGFVGADKASDAPPKFSLADFGKLDFGTRLQKPLGPRQPKSFALKIRVQIAGVRA